MTEEKKLFDEEMKWIEWRRDNQKLSAYYYGFSPVGVSEVDLVLAAVAAAGKGYHHTEDWGDPIRGEDGAPSYIDLIQEAANQAAARIRELEKDNERLQKDLASFTARR